MKFPKILIAIVLLSLLFSFKTGVDISNAIDVNQQVIQFCNNNLICETSLGETSNNCPSDCGCNKNSICEPLRGETANNCPSDCRARPGNRDLTPPDIYGLVINEIGIDATTISWKTGEMAICKLFFGETTQYIDGTIIEEEFSKKHSTRLIDLLPTTTYHFEVRCLDGYHNESSTKNHTFTTLSLPDTVSPPNVIDFRADISDEQITLKWENPQDFKGVKIMRSDKFYPSDPWDGMSVYNGKEESFKDKDLINGKEYYYTAFTYDEAGNYSSGAVISGIPSEEGAPLKPFPPEFPVVLPSHPDIEKITIADFIFSQLGEKISFSNGKIIGDGENPLTISIDYDKVPEVLKTLLVTLEKDDKFFSFLLRINEEKTAYEATVFSPGSGIYSLSIAILDYKHQAFKEIGVELLVRGIEEAEEDQRSYSKINIIYLLLFIILIVIVYKRRIRHKIR